VTRLIIFFNSAFKIPNLKCLSPRSSSICVHLCPSVAKLGVFVSWWFIEPLNPTRQAFYHQTPSFPAWPHFGVRRHVGAFHSTRHVASDTKRCHATAVQSRTPIPNRVWNFSETSIRFVLRGQNAFDFQRDRARARWSGGQLDFESLLVLRPLEFAPVTEQ
jgi:hypothetical protein